MWILFEGGDSTSCNACCNKNVARLGDCEVCCTMQFFLQLVLKQNSETSWTKNCMCNTSSRRIYERIGSHVTSERETNRLRQWSFVRYRNALCEHCATTGVCQQVLNYLLIIFNKISNHNFSLIVEWIIIVYTVLKAIDQGSSLLKKSEIKLRSFGFITWKKQELWIKLMHKATQYVYLLNMNMCFEKLNW